MSETFPEKNGDAPVSVLGMNLAAGLPRDVIPVSALVVVRCLAADDAEAGHDVLWWSATGGLSSWEISGMCSFVQHGIRMDWDEGILGNGEEEESGA